MNVLSVYDVYSVDDVGKHCEDIFGRDNQIKEVWLAELTFCSMPVLCLAGYISQSLKKVLAGLK